MGEGKKRRGKANDGANGQQGGHVPKEGDAATPSDEEQGVTPPSPRMPPIILRRAREGQEYRVVLGHHILDEVPFPLHSDALQGMRHIPDFFKKFLFRDLLRPKTRQDGTFRLALELEVETTTGQKKDQK